MIPSRTKSSLFALLKLKAIMASGIALNNRSGAALSAPRPREQQQNLSKMN